MLPLVCLIFLDIQQVFQGYQQVQHIGFFLALNMLMLEGFRISPMRNSDNLPNLQTHVADVAG
jgi:hypothetical protein